MLLKFTCINSNTITVQRQVEGQYRNRGGGQKTLLVCINVNQILLRGYKTTMKKILNARQKAGGSFSTPRQFQVITSADSLGLKLQHYLYICASDLRDN